MGQSWHGVLGRFCPWVARRRRGFGRWTGKPGARGGRRAEGRDRRRRDPAAGGEEPPGSPRGGGAAGPRAGRRAGAAPGGSPSRAGPGGRVGTEAGDAGAAAAEVDDEAPSELVFSQICSARKMCVEPVSDTAPP